MARPVNLGMPRIGPDRELKRVIEAYWRGDVSDGEVNEAARSIRADGWRRQVEAGIEGIPSNDFSFYDQMLDTASLVGAVPPRFDCRDGDVDLDTYFALARGRDGGAGAAHPLEMTKWFDTNYHYLVPELGPETEFRMMSRRPVDAFEEALDLGVTTRPVLIGPVTFLLLAKSDTVGHPTLDLLPRLLPVYAEVLQALRAAGADWVQLDEPCLATDLTAEAQLAYVQAYDALAAASTGRLLVAGYFGGLGDNVDLALGLPIDGIHIDAVRGPEQLSTVVDRLPASMVLSVGIVDGRNVWRRDLGEALDLLVPVHERVSDERLWVAPSCSLLHVPYDLDREHAIDPEVRSWLAFASQKLTEVVTLARGLTSGRAAITEALAESDRVVASRADAHAHRPSTTRARLDALTPADVRRHSPYDARRGVQRSAIPLPRLPTTTIGSFPQTAEIREARQQHASGRLGDDEYRRFCEGEIARVVSAQEAIGLDVLVHGEPERNDMVQYFGERLTGFAATEHAWVQSFGTRCVRPPILHGDVRRPQPMTVEWSRYAQSLTSSPVKGMLTGPVTILQWSFVRDDQPRAETCRELALAIRDEVADLERAGIAIIQVDEPALREGLPLRRSEWNAYLTWATECFRIATSGVDDRTQIHSHMCYAEFADIIDAVRALDADVISLEAARSGMDMLGHLARDRYPAGVGPGVYDIHAPHVPSEDEIMAIIEAACGVLSADQLWVNPDCGLKTRGWTEVSAALGNMVRAAHRVRAMQAS